MAHDWIFDVLRDMQSYARKNDLPALAAQLSVTLKVAREEIGEPPGPADSDGPED